MTAPDMTPTAQALVQKWSIPEPNTGCWLWLGVIRKDGYAQLNVPIGLRGDGKRVRPAYRYSYEAFKGPIPAGCEPDHLCRVRECVNPDHLEPVTRRENVFRGIGPVAAQMRATHCPQGHPYSGDNLILYTRTGSRTGRNKRTNPGRYCRACHQAMAKHWYRMRMARKRGEA